MHLYLHKETLEGDTRNCVKMHRGTTVITHRGLGCQRKGGRVRTRLSLTFCTDLYLNHHMNVSSIQYFLSK